jgi:general secretion pathway protein K
MRLLNRQLNTSGLMTSGRIAALTPTRSRFRFTSLFPCRRRRLSSFGLQPFCMVATDRGIVLIPLLWVLAALSLLALDLASTVRTEVNLTQASSQAAKSYFYAQGALEEALFHIVFPYPDSEKQKRLFPYAAGMNHYWMSDGEMRCHVAIQDEAGKLDLNFASPEILTRLLENLGMSSPAAPALADAIVEWRNPDSEKRDLDGISHGPFASIEELLLVRGMSREILYGRPEREEMGRKKGRRGLAEFVTVYSGKSQVNINYAEPEVIAALPGLDLDTAALIVQARAREPFNNSSELSERVTISDEALSLMTTDVSKQFCLTATAQVRGSKVRRSIRLIIKRTDKGRARHDKLMWYDEYWPGDEVLRWTETHLPA